MKQPAPKFSELQKVRVIDPKQSACEGLVIASLFRDGRWLYKLSIPDPDFPGATFDNWYAETALKLVKEDPIAEK